MRVTPEHWHRKQIIFSMICHVWIMVKTPGDIDRANVPTAVKCAKYADSFRTLTNLKWIASVEVSPAQNHLVNWLRQPGCLWQRRAVG